MGDFRVPGEIHMPLVDVDPAIIDMLLGRGQWRSHVPIEKPELIPEPDRGRFATRPRRIRGALMPRWYWRLQEERIAASEYGERRDIDLGGCNYYTRKGDGLCHSGCWEEPECITCEPEGGWPSANRAAIRADHEVRP